MIAGFGYYGQIHRIPGLFNVQTRFLHVFFFPLVPVSCWLMLEDGPAGITPRALKIPINYLSVLIAWLRGILGAGIFFGLMNTVTAAIVFAQENDVWPAGAIFGIGVSIAASLYGLMRWSYRLGQPNHKNACHYADLSGVPETALGDYIRKKSKDIQIDLAVERWQIQSEAKVVVQVPGVGNVEVQLPRMAEDGYRIRLPRILENGGDVFLNLHLGD